MTKIETVVWPVCAGDAGVVLQILTTNSKSPGNDSKIQRTPCNPKSSTGLFGASYFIIDDRLF